MSSVESVLLVVWGGGATDVVEGSSLFVVSAGGAPVDVQDVLMKHVMMSFATVQSLEQGMRVQLDMFGS